MSGFSLDPSLYADSSLASSLSSQPLQAQVAADGNVGTGAEPPQHATQVNEILKKKRKAREHKACYPCRQRKVKCDLSRPCQTCRDRDHPELCDYNPPSKRQAIEGPGVGAEAESGSTVVIGRYEFDILMKKLHSLESSILELSKGLGKQTSNEPIDPALQPNGSDTPNVISTIREHRELHGLHKSNFEGHTEHFGPGSIPAMLSALIKPNDDNAQEQLRVQLNTSLMPLFGLDETATYPFIDLWGIPHASSGRLRELARVIPDDAQALYLLRSYKSTAYVVFPGVADIEKFDREYTSFLVDRAAQIDPTSTVDKGLIFGKTYHWLGLFFAVLASGAQTSDMDRKQRTLTSQVYLCCAMESLRLTNFLSRATIESIQALLVIGNVLSDNMSAGTAWSLLGLTIRLAQGLGLHQPCPPGTAASIGDVRSRIWWAIVWQDSLLSLVYDRAGSEVLVKPNSMHMPTPKLGVTSSFPTAMYKLAKITLDIVHERDNLSIASDEVVKSKIEDYYEQVLEISRQSSDHLQDIRYCKTSPEQLEYWVLRLHSAYCLAELCRPALSPRRDNSDHRALCIDSLLSTIDAFLNLNATSLYARQSWAAMHRALSSALLLSIIGELGDENERATTLTVKFINIMHEITAGVEPQEVAGPIKRGVIALQRLRLPGTNFPEETLTDGVDVQALNEVLPSEAFESVEPQGNDVSPHSMVNDILWGFVRPTATSRGVPSVA